MSDYAYLEPGFIPEECINSPGELDQMVAGAQPVSTIAFVYVSATAPDIITYADLARAIWQDTSAVPHLNKLYNPTTLSWEVQVPAAGSITGSMIADDTIPLSKLQHTAGQAGFVIRENSSSTAYIADDPQNLFTTTDRLSVTVLSLSSAGDTYILTSNGIANTWGLFSSFLTAGVVPLTAIATTGAANPTVLSWNGTSLGYRTVVSATADATLPVGKLVPDTANYIPVTDPTGAFVTWVSPAQLVTLLTPSLNTVIGLTASALIAVPASGGSITPIAHGFGTVPKTANWVLVCITNDEGWVIGQEIPADRVLTNAGGGDYYQALYPAQDATNLTLIRGSDLTFAAVNGSTGNFANLTPARWNLRCYYGR